MKLTPADVTLIHRRGISADAPKPSRLVVRPVSDEKLIQMWQNFGEGLMVERNHWRDRCKSQLAQLKARDLQHAAQKQALLDGELAHRREVRKWQATMAVGAVVLFVIARVF